MPVSKSSVASASIYGRFCSYEAREFTNSKTGQKSVVHNVRIETEPGRSVVVSLPRGSDPVQFANATYDNYVSVHFKIVPGDYDKPALIVSSVEIE